MLETIKNNTEESSTVEILAFMVRKPTARIRQNPEYTNTLIRLRPKNKSDKNKLIKGIKIATNLFEKRAAEKSAIPVMGAKLGGCGINLVATANTISPNATQCSPLNFILFIPLK